MCIYIMGFSPWLIGFSPRLNGFSPWLSMRNIEANQSGGGGSNLICL